MNTLSISYLYVHLFGPRSLLNINIGNIKNIKYKMKSINEYQNIKFLKMYSY